MFSLHCVWNGMECASEHASSSVRLHSWPLTTGNRTQKCNNSLTILALKAQPRATPWVWFGHGHQHDIRSIVHHSILCLCSVTASLKVNHTLRMAWN